MNVALSRVFVFVMCVCGTVLFSLTILSIISLLSMSGKETEAVREIVREEIRAKVLEKSREVVSRVLSANYLIRLV